MVVAVVCFSREAPWKGAKGVIVLPGITDNSGNSYLIDKFMSTEFPLNIWLMELAVQQNLFNFQVHLAWHPESRT